MFEPKIEYLYLACLLNKWIWANFFSNRAQTIYKWLGSFTTHPFQFVKKLYDQRLTYMYILQAHKL